MGLNSAMTYQIPHTCIFKRKKYSLLGSNGSGLFHPADHGIKVQYISTGCWRGFQCAYTIKNSRLFLTTVHLGLDYFDKATDSVVIFGRKPERYMQSGTKYEGRKIVKTWSESSDYRIDSLHEPIGFTGGILIGSSSMREYSGGIFRPLYAFQVLHEVIFEKGKVVANFDRFKEMEEIRRFIAEQPDDMPHFLAPDLHERIKQDFSMEYRL